jgi:Trypsin-like peptidase domain
MSYRKSFFLASLIVAAALAALFFAADPHRETAPARNDVFSIPAPQIQKAYDKAVAHEMKGSFARRLMSVHIDVDDSAGTKWRPVQSASGMYSRRLTLRAEGAAFIRPHFARHDNNHLSISVYGPDAAEAIPISLQRKNRDDAGWWGPIVSGDVLVVEIESDGDLPPIVIDKISYGLKSYRDKEKEQRCHLDVNCYDQWENIKDGVAMMHFESNGSGFACTGSLLKDSYSTRRPWFLTANHCIGNQAEAETLIVYWEYETVECDGPSRSLLASDTNEGADYVTGSDISDFALLLLHDDPPFGIPFLDFSLDNLEHNEQIAVINHPGGTFKRISFGKKTGEPQNFWEVVYSEGSTEEGSSGSPLFNARHEIVGQLSSGNAACWRMFGKDQYGKISSSWLLGLEEHLATEATTTSTTTTTIPNSADDDDMEYSDDDDTEDSLQLTQSEEDDSEGCGC